jgi:hypothetical protein
MAQLVTIALLSPSHLAAAMQYTKQGQHFQKISKFQNFKKIIKWLKL